MTLYPRWHGSYWWLHCWRGSFRCIEERCGQHYPQSNLTTRKALYVPQ